MKTTGGLLGQSTVSFGATLWVHSGMCCCKHSLYIRRTDITRGRTAYYLRSLEMGSDNDAMVSQCNTRSLSGRFRLVDANPVISEDANGRLAIRERHSDDAILFEWENANSVTSVFCGWIDVRITTLLCSAIHSQRCTAVERSDAAGCLISMVNKTHIAARPRSLGSNSRTVWRTRC